MQVMLEAGEGFLKVEKVEGRLLTETAVTFIYFVHLLVPQ